MKIYSSSYLHKFIKKLNSCYSLSTTQPSFKVGVFVNLPSETNEDMHRALREQVQARVSKCSPGNQNTKNFHNHGVETSKDKKPNRLCISISTLPFPPRILCIRYNIPKCVSYQEFWGCILIQFSSETPLCYRSMHFKDDSRKTNR